MVVCFGGLVRDSLSNIGMPARRAQPSGGSKNKNNALVCGPSFIKTRPVDLEKSSGFKHASKETGADSFICNTKCDESC